MNQAQRLGVCVQISGGWVESACGGRRHLGDVQDAGSYQLSGEPIQPLVEAHPAAGVTALNVPAPPTAQLVQT